ncbi:MAG: hypothetical protein ACLQBD_07725 [Syntrophobacteraceae bacterium]
MDRGFLIRMFVDLLFIQIIVAPPWIAKELVVFILLKPAQSCGFSGGLYMPLVSSGNIRL